MNIDSAKTSKNILWIDIAKFVAMFLVVFEHAVLAFQLKNSAIIGDIRNIIVSFHMPLFFIIAGYLYKERAKKENYNKILWSLLIPYLLYQFLYLPFKLGYYCFSEHIPYITATIKSFIGILLGDNLGTKGSKYALSVCPACWFIMVMIQLRFIFAQIQITPKKLLAMSILSLLLQKILMITNIDLYFCIDNTLYAIPYFAFGFFIANYAKKNIFNIQKHKYMLFVIALVLTNIAYLARTHYNEIIILKYLCGFIGSYMLIALSHFFSKTNKFVDEIAKNTLFLIFFQSLFLFITKWLNVYKIFNINDAISFQLLIVTGYSIIIYIVAYYIIKFLKLLNLDIILGKKRSIEK